MEKSNKFKIHNWFLKHKSGGLILPDGWFGRPYDNLHQLTGISEKESSLEIILDTMIKIKFVSLKSIHTNNKELILSNFEKVYFKWTEYGSEIEHEKVFDSGEVRIVNIS